MSIKLGFTNTVKPVLRDRSRETPKTVFTHRWSLLTGSKFFNLNFLATEFAPNHIELTIHKLNKNIHNWISK